MPTADVVVVGGGHNGLVCAAYLADAGLDVCVVERNPTAGGALFSTTTADGTRLEQGGVDHSTIVASPIPDELDLGRHGLRYLERTASALHLFGDGARVAIAATAEETAASIRQVDRADADAWLELVDHARELMAFTAELTGGRVVPLPVALRAGRAALGAKGRPMLDLATMAAVDVARRWFRSPHLRAVCIARSTFSGLPAWYPGTGAVFALTPAGHGRTYARPEGGSAAFVAALERAVTGRGGRVLTGFAVTSVRRRGDGWAVHAGDDTVVARRAVVSALPPQDFLLRLVEPNALPDRLRRRLRSVEVVAANLGQFTLSAALGRLPDLAGATEPGFEGSMLWLTAEPRDALASQTAALAGDLADRPPVVSTFPSVVDPTIAPGGRASLWANGHLAARLARTGGWPAAREDLAERVWATIDACLGGVRDLVTEQVLTTPDEVTAHTGAESPGQHLASTLDQLFGRRPVPGCADHRTPLPGIYLTGAGTNPGPGISGLPGRECAHAVLDDLGARPGGAPGRATSAASAASRAAAAVGAEVARAGRLGRRSWAVRRG